jgi:hypothetical protein
MAITGSAFGGLAAKQLIAMRKPTSQLLLSLDQRIFSILSQKLVHVTGHEIKQHFSLDSNSPRTSVFLQNTRNAT